jgi:hypothetical protein
MTVDDPKIFTALWTEDIEMKFHPEWAKVPAGSAKAIYLG